VQLSIGLINYWPFNSDTLDHVGQANMTDGFLSGSLNNSYTYLDQDRFGHPNSALNLNNWFKTLSDGAYFYGDFSISLWIKYSQVVTGQTSTFLSFSSQNIFFGFDSFSSIELGIIPFSVTTTIQVKTGFWSFVVVTLEGSIGSIYLDGILAGQNVTVALASASHTNNFVGALNVNSTGVYGTSFNVIDELRIYNRSLSNTEIIYLMSIET
jgi:hypothetical protein